VCSLILCVRDILRYDSTPVPGGVRLTSFSPYSEAIRPTLPSHTDDLALASNIPDSRSAVAIHPISPSPRISQYTRTVRQTSEHSAEYTLCAYTSAAAELCIREVSARRCRCSNCSLWEGWHKERVWAEGLCAWWLLHSPFIIGFRRVRAY
jgi:hypothetical protein